MWFYLLAQHGMMYQICKAWWTAKAKFYKAQEEHGNPWGTVTGPLGATLATLVTIGWNPITPLKWIDHRGGVWEYSGRGSLYPLLQAVKEAVQHKVWAKASQHHLGEGLQAGVDMTVYNRIYKKIVQDGQHSTAGSLLNAVAGGIW